MPELAAAGPSEPPSFDGRPGEYSRVQPSARLVLLTVLTLGLYQFYWFHRNWTRLRDEFGEPLSPGWRTLGLLVPFVNIVLVHQQFRMLARALRRAGAAANYSPALLTAAFFALAFAANVSGLWPLSLLTVLPLIPVHEAMNGYWSTVDRDRPVREGFSPGELAAMTAGGLLLLLATAATLGA